jgi:hypothetical protein
MTLSAHATLAVSRTRIKTSDTATEENLTRGSTALGELDIRLYLPLFLGLFLATQKPSDYCAYRRKIAS